MPFKNYLPLNVSKVIIINMREQRNAFWQWSDATKKSAFCNNFVSVLMQLTCGCHHDNGALEIIIGRRIKTVVFVANKRPSLYLFLGYIHYVSIHGAHCQNGHDDSHYYEEHIEASVGRLKTGSTEKPAAAVAIASKAQQRQRRVQERIDPDDGEDHSGSVGIEDACIFKSEADLCELVDGGPGE